MSTFCPRGQGGGVVKCPRLSTRGGEGVKIGQNLVHVVVECPLMEISPEIWKIRQLLAHLWQGSVSQRVEVTAQKILNSKLHFHAHQQIQGPKML